MASEDLRYTFYALRRGQFFSEANKTALDRLKESLSEVWEKEVWPPSSPSGTLWTILCLASLSQCKALQQSCIHHLKDHGGNGVPRQGHHGEGLQELQVHAVLRQSTLLTAISLKKLILNLFLCHFIFILIKTADFQLCCAIF